VTKLLQNRIT